MDILNISLSTGIWAFLGGLIPALIWLWFWLKEDKRHPEPARLIISAFIAGMLMVPIALLFETLVKNWFEKSAYFAGGALSTILFTLWAAIEELLKYFAAYVVAFRKACIDRSRCLDETIDPLIYLITAALGFAALENMLFLIVPLEGGEPFLGFVTGNLRFVGATVLHVIASGAIGVAMGLSFYKTRAIKRTYVLLGIFTAISLHTLFNLSIIQSEGAGILATFSAVWVGVFVLLALFEKIKGIRKNKS